MPDLAYDAGVLRGAGRLGFAVGTPRAPTADSIVTSEGRWPMEIMAVAEELERKHGGARAGAARAA